MFMVLSKTIQEMQHIENIVAFVCGGIVLAICAVCCTIFAEKRVSRWEERQLVKEQLRLQKAENEVQREKENFRFVDADLKKENERLRKENEKLRKDNENYKQQLDEIDLGTFNGRSLKHV